MSPNKARCWGFPGGFDRENTTGLVLAEFDMNQTCFTESYLQRITASRIRWTGMLCFLLLAMTVVQQAAADEALLEADRKWSGDLDGMIQRRVIRVLTPYSRTFYFLDGAQQAGITFEAMQIFEEWLNRELGGKKPGVHIVLIPTPSEELLSGLREGRGDIAAGNLTITPERRKIVDFSDPFARGGKEIIVAGREVAGLQSLQDLAGREIVVRPSSSYAGNLQRLNRELKKAGKKQIRVVKADPYLEDEDILEMVNAGLVAITAVDAHLAELWSRVFENITVYPDLAVHTGSDFGWAFRRNSPKLKEMVNRFAAGHKQKSMLFNVITNRYLQSTRWVKNALAPEELQRFSDADDHFKKYAGQYGFDWLLIAAMAYQESGIDQSRRSPAGAIGVMQMLPATAGDPNVDIPDIKDLENNIHAGVKYLRFLRDRYFAEEQMDDLNRTLFAMASYNAGPARIARLRSEAGEKGYDENIWFRNVEVIAALRIGRETVQYVRNIYKYYLAYRHMVDNLAVKKEVKNKGL